MIIVRFIYWVVLGTVICFLAYAKEPSTFFEYTCTKEKDKTFCVVTLDHSIVYSGYYKKLLNLLYFSDKNTTIVINVTGFGGSAQGAVAIINGIRHSQAVVITNVIGDVFSAHTLIALAGDKTIISGDGVVMLHNVSGTNMEKIDCLKNYFKKDRGQWLYYKCLENQSKYSQIYNSIFKDLVKKVLTKKELKRYNNGFEVIMTLQELKKRLK